MKHMKCMIPEKPTNTKVGLYGIARTNVNNVNFVLTAKNSSTQRIMLFHPFFPINPSIDQIKNTFRRYA